MKEKIQQYEGIPLKDMQLVFQGCDLEDDNKRLYWYNVKEGSIIDLKLRPSLPGRPLEEGSLGIYLCDFKCRVIECQNDRHRSESFRIGRCGEANCRNQRKYSSTKDTFVFTKTRQRSRVGRLPYARFLQDQRRIISAFVGHYYPSETENTGNGGE